MKSCNVFFASAVFRGAPVQHRSSTSEGIETTVQPSTPGQGPTVHGETHTAAGKQIHKYCEIISSPEHEVLIVSYCGQWLSDVRRRVSSVMRRPSTFDVYTL